MIAPRFTDVCGSCVNPADGTTTIPWDTGSGMPRPPKNRPPNRVLWPPMPKIVALVAFQPRLIRNGTGGLAQVFVTAMYTSPLVYDFAGTTAPWIAAISCTNAPETNLSPVRTTPPTATPGVHGPNCPSLIPTTLP